MYPSFSFNPEAKQFKPSDKVKKIYEVSKIDLSDLQPKLWWDPKNPAKPIWKDFNLVKPSENTDEDGEINGSNYNDYIPGTNRDETINGFHGSDLIYGGDGNDRLYGDCLRHRPTDGVDTVYGGRGNDTIRADYAYGQEGHDVLYAPHFGGAYLDGGIGNDRLIGAQERDTLVGGVGNDYLKGGSDSDTMTGGRGVDHFVVGQGNDHLHGISRDLITDFDNIGDRIQFHVVSSRNLSYQDLDFAFNAAGSLVVSTDVELIDDDQRRRVSGDLAEIQGLNSSVGLEQQIEYTGNGVIELIAAL